MAYTVAAFGALLILTGCQSVPASTTNTNTNTPPINANTNQPGAASVTIRTGQNQTLGTFLVVNGMTLYVFKNDTPGVSNCSGQCLVIWPPLTDNGNVVAGTGVTGTLGTITRSDGTKQVTYNNQPLYYYLNDLKAGDTLGEGINNVWYVAKP